ncbi:phosphoenolpyruvate--protein phosphotransferase [bacterium F11]|nr:phosphoenolpyruvate--protein phosphotransferase [bacterium F11]
MGKIEKPSSQNFKKGKNQGDVLRGFPLSPGVVFGDVLIIGEEIPYKSNENGSIEDIELELDLFRGALSKIKEELIFIHKQVSSEIGKLEAAIFEAQIKILEDTALLNQIERTIENRKWRFEISIDHVLNYYQTEFSKVENPLFRDKIHDLKDVLSKIKKHGRKKEAEKTLDESSEKILIAKEIYPSLIPPSSRQKIIGLVTVVGGMGSHAAALARSYGIPAVGLSPNEIRKLKNNSKILIDGHGGHIFIKPSTDILLEYKHTKREFEQYKSKVNQLAFKDSRTKDGVPIYIDANCGTMADVKQAMDYGADGIGLFRTELMFYIYGRFPSEEEQFQIYKEIFEAFKGKPVTIRTLDIGGDKILPYFVIPKQLNPFLGWRSLKISFEQPEIFKDQIKAILRAAQYGNGRILFPMVTSFNDIVKAKEYVAICGEELRKQGIDFTPHIQCGAMVEVPAAIFGLKDILQVADFVTIGTNDLIQHLLAVDRNNPKVAPFYLPHHPSVLAALSEIIKMANLAEKSVSLCGEMASNPIYLPLLIGLGLKKLSMVPNYIPIIKDIARAVDHKKTHKFVEELRSLKSADAIEEKLSDITKEWYPEVTKISH